MSEDYCTLAEVKAGAEDLNLGMGYDDALADGIVRASRLVDRYMGREDGAYVALTTATARYFDGFGDATLFIDECVEISAVSHSSDGVNWTDWEATDYQTLDGDGSPNTLPICALRIDPYQGSYTVFTAGWSNYKVTAKWGYSAAVPDLVKAACVAQVLYSFGRAQQGYADQGGLTESGIVLRMQGLCKDARDFLDQMPKRL